MQTLEPYVTLKEISTALNIPYWKLQRAARIGLLKTYRFYNSRLLFRLSEVVATIEGDGRE